MLSFARIIESENPSRSIRIGAVVLSFVLAWLTYKLVERPVRFGKNGKVKVIALLVLMTIVGLVGYNSFENDGLKFRDAEKTVKINRFDKPYRESCEEITGEPYEDDWCNDGTNSRNPVITVMIGDSFSNAYSTMLRSYSEKSDINFSFRQLGRGQCPSLLEYGPAYCRLIAEKTFDFIKQSSDVKIVVLASNWFAHYSGMDFNWVKHVENKDAFVIAFEKTVRAYRDMGKRVVILLAPPVGGNPKSCIVRPFRLTSKNSCDLTKLQALDNDGNYRNYMIPFLDQMGIRYFDPFKYLCGEVNCKLTDGEKIFYADVAHMSDYGGDFLATQGDRELKILLSN